jgi:bifunctional enzyme CysN/CysC
VTESSPQATAVRVVLLGQVDHGKSTLVGRLLLDTGSLPEGKLEQIRAVSKRRGLDLELAFAVDALMAERDQLITIDAAHVWIRTPRRECVIVDAPGHEEFLKNMVTGAASADAALLLVDAKEGLGVQSRRHAYLVQLLGLEQVAVVVNKMDLAGYGESVFRRIESEFAPFLASLGVRSSFIAASARQGANVVQRSKEMPWYAGPTVLEAIEGFAARAQPADGPLRFPLQDVYKLDERRILAGRVESGTIKTGDRLVFSPWNKVGFVKTIEGTAGPCAEARAGDSIGITLDASVFVERGQVASHLTEAPIESDVFDARVFWLGRSPLETGKDYRIKIATQESPCRIEKIHRIVDVKTLETVPGSRVDRNGIAEVTIRTPSAVAIDPFSRSAPIGRFVIVDGYDIAGGGVVLSGEYSDQRTRISGLKSANISATSGKVSRAERFRRTGHRGRVLWFTGLSASGKSTLAALLERELFDAGYFTYRLDGDDIRHGLSANLGFSDEDRAENVRRVGEVARLMADAGAVVIVALISPRESERQRVRATMRQNEFVEIFTDCPLPVCEERDPRGLYHAAREGKIKGFTGVDAPYEPPSAPEIILRTAESSVRDCLDQVKERLRALEAQDG